MEQRARLTASIIRNVLGFWLFHSVIFASLVYIYRLDSFFVILYLVISLLLDGILLTVLLITRHQFYLLETSQNLDHVNFANKLTLFRISSLPSLVLLFIASRTQPVALVLIIYASIAFITDLLDGLVSRKTHQTTRVGQYLDSMSDYAVLLGVAIAFVSFGFISSWFFILVLVRYMAQWVSMAILFILKHGSVEPRTSFLGKASVAITMVTFAANLLRLFDWFKDYNFWLSGLEIFASVVLAISLIEKLMIFRDDFRQHFKDQA